MTKGFLLLSVAVLALFPVQADGGVITLRQGGGTLQGTLISRPDSATGRPVVTVVRPDGGQVFQFDIADVAVIQSGTGDLRILKQAAAVMDGTGESPKVVRRFTEGMEFRAGERSGSWMSVTPAAEGLAADKGWLPADLLVRRLDLPEPPKEEATEPSGHETAPGGETAPQSPLPSGK